jgi:hypothetical protein
MATLPRMESGRMQAVGISGAVTPNVQAQAPSYTGIQRAVSANQQMAQTLDRLSGSLFNTAGTYAAEQATRFAAENPITNVQLQAAVNGDLKPLDLNTGGGGAIYQRAMEKARAFQLSSAFEVEARSQLTKMLVALESGDDSVTTANFQTAITSLSDGFSKAVGAQSPEAAMKLRASIATTGNTVLQKAAEFELKRDKERKAIALRIDFSNTERILEATISQGFWVDGEGQRQSIESIITAERKNMAIKALTLGDGQLAKEYADRFETAVRTAKINVLTQFIVNDEAMMADPDLALQKLRTGDLGKMSEVAQILAATDYAAIKTISANVMTEANSLYTLAQRQAEVKKDADVIRFVSLYTQAIAMPVTDGRRPGLVLQMNEIAKNNPEAVPLGVLKDLNEPDKDGNAMIEFNALAMIYRGQITTPEQLAAVRGLSGKQSVGLLKALISQDKANDTKLNAGLAKLAGISTIPGVAVSLDPKGAQFKQLGALRARAASLQAQADADGKYLSIESILLTLEKEVSDARNTEAVKAAQARLTNYEKQDWINGPITRDSLPALELKAKGNKSRENILREITRQLNIIEGVNQ